MKNVILAMLCALTLIAAPLAAQTGSGSGSGSGSGRSDQTKQEIEKKAAEAVAVTTKIAETPGRPGPRFVSTLTNVQIELTLSDQLGAAAAEKKTISMIASSGSWGKIRSAGTIRPEGDAPYPVVLNVDARPFVSVDGQIQLELSFEYVPLKSGGEQKEGALQRPSGINQSQTVVLQSGKPLTVSQAADPISSRKVVVEVKATVLK
jgi:hypothetical protein